MSPWRIPRHRPSATKDFWPKKIRRSAGVTTTSSGEPRTIPCWHANICCARRCSRACSKPMRFREEKIMGTAMKRAAFFALLMTLAAVHAAAAQSAAWPERPIRLIVPFPAGSSSDIVARIVAQRLGERLGQQLVVENRPGASGNLGTEAVAHAAPDVYTLGLANTSTHTLSPSLMANPAYDPVKDFAPISMIGASPFVLALYPGVPAKTVPELIALAKTKPAKLTFASAGPATLANLAGILFAKTAHIELTPVSYRGSGQEILDFVAGRIDMAFATIPPTLPLIRDGKVRAIAVTGPQRSPALADLPTVAESGLP